VGAPDGYWLAVAVGSAAALTLCAAARRRPGRWTASAGRAIALILIADAIASLTPPIVDGTWTAQSSLPLDLCNVTVVIAAVACWWPRIQFAVELTYFWGLAGSLQAVITPDLSVGFPHLEFVEFVVGHLAIVTAALFLVAGMGLRPRPGSVPRVFAITVAYTGAVAVVDWLTHANYMYLAAIPGHASLLSVLGPWPWYILSAAGIALALLLLLDAPFRRSRALDTASRQQASASAQQPK
jgi:hypothetical integral membrane protein (TIGR02206 family)